ncbi:MAG: acyl-CoA thioesterase [Hyphomicrobiales bacterium]
MTQPTDEERRALDELLTSLDLEPLGDDRFRGPIHQREGRLFGGLILAQAVMAAGRTATKGDIHSLHAYFLRGGKPAIPVDYQVERIREGRTFITRRVTAIQGGDVIFEASVGYTLPEPGISHQAPMPAAPDPEGQPTWWETLMRTPVPRRMRWINPVDIRTAEFKDEARGERLPSRAVWTRVVGQLLDDPHIHAAMMAFMSDSGLVGTVANSYGLWNERNTSASLDHAIWWHRPPRFDDWILYTSESPAAHNARALIFGAMYTRDGVRVASVAQEGLFRELKPGEQR